MNGFSFNYTASNRSKVDEQKFSNYNLPFPTYRFNDEALEVECLLMSKQTNDSL